VPNRSDVDRVERDLLARASILFAGRIGTFDDLFDEIAAGDPHRRPLAAPSVRDIAVRRVVAGAQLGELAASAGSAGFADSLLRAIAELDAALVADDPGEGGLGRLRAAYHDELERRGLQDRDGRRATAVRRLTTALDAWQPGRPVFAYGFEDLTAAEWALLEALAGRTDVTVSIPYEPGRVAFASLSRTVDDLASLAGNRIEELAPRADGGSPAALRLLERRLFADAGGPITADGAPRVARGRGAR